jgi:hypothetical protein
MYTDDTPETAPARRRIVPQPLRTEAPFALIAGDTPLTSELEARLKRDHPLITFPSLSHFLAEPARRTWVAIVVARSGAWDHRLDSYVRRRGCIALFGLTEESYGWPEAVVRVRDLAELDAWLQALNAPQPELKRERPKRTPRAQLVAAASAPSARWSQESAGEAKAAPPASPGNTLRPLAAAAPLPRRAAPSAVSLRGDRAKTTAGNGARALHKAGPRKSSVVESRAELHARSVALARALAREAPRSDDRAADLKFARIAAELGLSRAFELLAELRARATQLALSMGR